MELTNTEKRRIVIALYVLECQIYAGEVHYELESELKGVKGEDIRELMDKIDKTTRR